MLNYGEKLKDFRITNQKTLVQIQQETGISNQNLSRWERNEVIPNIDFCVNLADYYGVSLDELVGRADDFGNVTVINNSAELSEREQKLLLVFKDLSELEQDKLIEDAKFYAERHKTSLEEKIS